MIFGLVRLAIWLAGLLVVVYVGLTLFGYEMDWKYFESNKSACEEAIKACQNTLIKKGLDGAREQCNLKCAHPELLIKKKDT